MTTTRIPLLDHGYIEVVEHWGSDARIIEAARMSTQKGFHGWGHKGGWAVGLGYNRFIGVEGPDAHRFPVELNEALLLPEKEAHHLALLYPNHAQGIQYVEPTVGDEKLLKYLYENAHSTPFEFAGLTVEVCAPIMVFREWHRHRTQGYAEASARYAPLPDFNYVPTVERCLVANTANRQAGSLAGAPELTGESAAEWLEYLEFVYRHAEWVYQDGLKRGIPKELARLPVPVGRYTRMRATSCLRNWLGFMTLRSVPTAQWEIRQYSDVIATMLRERYPHTMELFDAPSPKDREIARLKIEVMELENDLEQYRRRHHDL